MLKFQELDPLFPSPVILEASAPSEAGSLFPEEAQFIRNAVQKRREEFTTVRGCARRALSKLGAPLIPLVPNPSRDVQWPAGVVGSLSHCDGMRIAAVALQSQVLGLGIDVEIHEQLSEGIVEIVCNSHERQHLADLALTYPGIFWERIAFSAKESIFKAWFPLTRRWLDFNECDLAIDPEARSYEGRILASDPQCEEADLSVFHGQWRVEAGFIFTGVTVPRLCENK